MKKFLSILLALVMITGIYAFAQAEEAGPKLVEAVLVTEVMDWGETLTAIRLEYSEEIPCDAFDITACDFSVRGLRNITYAYVNNSGELGNIEPTGKYVFLKLDVLTSDGNRYLEQVAFIEASSSRPKLNYMYVYQHKDLVTCTGAVIPAGYIQARNEIRVGIDDFKNIYITTVDDTDFYLNLYIPEGYEEKSDGLENLPLVVHYPSGDYACVDYNGIYNGALYRHNDATVWASKEVQSRHPSFVVTIGASKRIANTMYGTFDEIWASGVYADEVKKLIETYNIDPARVYAISLAGGTTMMWNTIMRYPDLYAASISTAFDFYMSYPDPDVAFANMKSVLDACPCWFFSGLKDSTGSDPFELGRVKGERLRDIAYLANDAGYKIDVAFGEAGELMWNGVVRGAEADKMAQEQLDRAAANGDTSLVTLFYPNTLPTSQHWSWQATYTNSVVQDWLYSQSK